jgi:uncharacterized protein (DUF305 family)
MRRNTWMLRIAFASVLLASVLVAGTFAVTARRGTPATESMAGDTSVARGTPGTNGMMGTPNPATAYDLQFLQEMIPHHEMAIGMARGMISQSDHPELRDLAQRIITGQQRQIDQMHAWEEQWYPNAPMPQGMMGSGMMGNTGTGMMGGMMMRPGDRTDRMFLAMMIPHHQRAIDMSEDALKNAQHPEMHGLATDIIAVQSAEITEMQGYLDRSW